MRFKHAVPALIVAVAACSSSNPGGSTGLPRYTLTMSGVPNLAAPGTTLYPTMRVFTPAGYASGVSVTFTATDGTVTVYSDTTDSLGRDSVEWILPSTAGRYGIKAYLTQQPTYQTPESFVTVQTP